jgi:hypothetical protein
MQNNDHLRNTLLSFGAVSSIACVLGVIVFKTKHIRGYSSQDCKYNIIALTLPDASACCDERNYSFLNFHICDATFHWSNKYITSFYQAWMLPLMPILATFAHDVYNSDIITLYNKSILYYHLKRVFVVYTIFLFRAYVLYKGFDILQTLLQSPESNECWYLPLLHYRGCKDNFDFSDHIVLFQVQYLLPCAVEVAYIRQCSSLPICKGIVYWLTFLIIGIFLIVTLRGTFITSAFYHTQEESLVAVLVSIFAAYVPTYYLLRKTHPFKNSCNSA